MNIESPFERASALLVLAASLLLLITEIGRAQSSPLLVIMATNGAVRLNVTGEVATPASLQYASGLGGTNAWTTLTNFTLLSGSAQFVDSSGTTNGARYYRTVTTVPAGMAWISTGTFLMGSPTNELERSTNELRHTVTLSKGFYAGKYLVTQSNYLSLINTNPSYFVTNNGYTKDLGRPVEQVTWLDASNYCYRLTQQERSAGRIFTNWSYRLPTEAEWEYFCRAGSTNAFCYGTNLQSAMANFNGQYEYIGGVGTQRNPAGQMLGRTSTVGSYAPNAWGLYDTTGNVWEWCQDWFGVYSAGSVTDPQGPSTGLTRVFRGGALNSTGRFCRSASRDSYNPTTGFNTVGFRVVLAYGP